MVNITDNHPLHGYQQNIRVANGDVEVVVATEFGPRIIAYSKVGGRNVLGELSPQKQSHPTGFGESWHVYGGHRLWYAPEHAVRTYWPDNQPVTAEHQPHGVKLTQQVEGHTGIRKSLTVSLSDQGSEVRLVHRLQNEGAQALQLAPWAITVMAVGGLAIFPQAEFAPYPQALSPARPLVLWPYTRMNDPRWTWGDRYFTLRHDPARADAQKVGFFSKQGYMAYALDDLLFVKLHTPERGHHADFNCNVETFTNDLLLELETLGPMAKLDPGASAEHIERWRLYDGVRLSGDEASITSALAPILHDIQTHADSGSE
ncbi:MAG TPA: hypothetical protein VI072_01315 [Polyangiaceae bacterium]